MDFYSLESMNRQAQHESVASASPISNLQAASASSTTRSTATNILQTDAILCHKGKSTEDELPSNIVPDLQDSPCGFSNIEEGMKSWQNDITFPEIWNMDKGVTIFNPASFYQSTSSSMPDFVGPRAVFSQEDSQDIFGSRSTLNQKPLWPIFNTPTQVHQQSEQNIADIQYLPLQYNHASSSVMQLNCCPASNSNSEETIASIVNQIHTNSKFSSQGDSPHKPSILPQHARGQRGKKNMDKEREFLASKDSKKLNSNERRRLLNRMSASTCRKKKKKRIAQLELDAKENKNLRIQNRFLIEENARSMAFIKTLRQHPALIPFLEGISRDATMDKPILLTSPTASTE